MKRVIQILAIILVMLIPVILSAQPMPYDESIGGGDNVPIGGGAPIGGGILLMLSLAIGYGAKKLVDARRKVLD